MGKAAVDLAEPLQDLLDQGWCVIPDALSPHDLRRARTALESAASRMRESGVSTHSASADPNDANIRVYSLPEWDPVFIEMLRHPVALTMVDALLGPHSIVSAFSANIALPGSRSMKVHSDQAAVTPPPWNEPWAINVIWCLDDVTEANGATRYVPGTHRCRTLEELPDDLADRTVAFTAKAGSLIAMDGRLWHTSGANVTADQQRAMLFAFYSCDFVRQQVNWEAALSPGTKEGLDEEARQLLGMGAIANVRVGGKLIRLNPDAPTPNFGAGAEVK